ncbi:hypothetical protein CR513_25833, partial [Mucuna pruriens]
MSRGSATTRLKPHSKGSTRVKSNMFPTPITPMLTPSQGWLQPRFPPSILPSPTVDRPKIVHAKVEDREWMASI